MKNKNSKHEHGLISLKAPLHPFRPALALLCAGIVALQANLAFAVETGSLAPDFSLQGIAHPLQLSDFKGKVVYLDFWASWCGPCKQSFPWMNDLQAKYGPQGFKVIAVNVDTNAEEWKKFLEKVPARFDIALDPQGTVASQYKVKAMPTSLIIGSDGKVLVEHQGFNEHTRSRSEKILSSLFGDKQ